MEHQNWNYTVITTKKATRNFFFDHPEFIEHVGSEKLGTKAISEGKDVETVKKSIISIFFS
jgi:hypothetical protein